MANDLLPPRYVPCSYFQCSCYNMCVGDLYKARMTRPQETPLWVTGIFTVANLFLNSLNLYWFSKMIDSLRRRAEIREKKSGEHED